MLNFENLELSRKLQLGSKGATSFGGNYSTIIEPIKYKKNRDGSISYTVTGKSIVHGIKSYVIGVGDTKDKIKITTSTGKIMPDGLIITNGNKNKYE